MARYWFWRGTMLCVMMVMQLQTGAAKPFKVGGNGGWAPPSGSEKETYNQWAEQNRFVVGDTVVFTYNPSVDSVLEVNKQDYETCTTSNPIHSYNDGNTVFTFPRHSAFYFISGNATNCLKGEKLVIVVLAPRRKNTATPPTVASPPSSSVATAPSSTVASPHSPFVTPHVAPVASPSAAPVLSPTAASGPAIAPGGLAPEVSSPSPAPAASQGGVVPSRSAGEGVRPRLVIAAFSVMALVFSVAF